MKKSRLVPGPEKYAHVVETRGDKPSVRVTVRQIAGKVDTATIGLAGFRVSDTESAAVPMDVRTFVDSATWDISVARTYEGLLHLTSTVFSRGGDFEWTITDGPSILARDFFRLDSEAAR